MSTIPASTAPISRMGGTGSGKRLTVWSSPFVRIALLIFCLCVGVAALFFGREWRATKALAAERLRGQQSGLPTNNAQYETWLAKGTHREGTEAWLEIFQLADETLFGLQSFTNLPILGDTGGLPFTPVPPGDPWPEEPVVAGVLNWLEPLFEKMDQAEQYPVPVWLPRSSDKLMMGGNLYYQDPRMFWRLVNLLRLDVEHALYHRDAERVLAGLNRFHVFTKAIDYETMAFRRTVSNLKMLQLQLIGKSLSYDLWSKDQMAQLREQLSDPVANINPLLNEILVLRSYALNEDLPLKLGGLPSDRMVVVQRYNQWLDQLDSSLLNNISVVGRWVRPLDTLGSNKKSRKTQSAYEEETRLWSFSQQVKIQMCQEDYRRFIKTAIAIKHYQFEKGQWPESLDQLDDVGLEVRDYTTVKGQRFGYSPPGNAGAVSADDLPQRGASTDLQSGNLAGTDRGDRDQESEVAWLWSYLPWEVEMRDKLKSNQISRTPNIGTWNPQIPKARPEESKDYGGYEPPPLPIR